MLGYQDIIKMKCTEINSLPEKEIYRIINVVIDYYYEKGFPYYPIDENKIQKEFNYLCEYDVKKLELENNHLQQNMMGLNSVNAFHPEMWSVQCNDSKTPMEIFQDRNLFMVALRKRIKYSDTRLLDYNIRKSLKAFGTQSVSNFRPTIAKWVYQMFSPDGGDVLDPCAGYGGRLFGAMCSHVGEYVGIDPSEESVTGNINLAITLSNISKGTYPNCLLKKLPFEDYETKRKFDLVFTSPPYFNTEKYSDDSNQSYIRYPEYSNWRDNFLKVLISNSYGMLKENGYLVLNVGKPIDKDTYIIGTEIFRHEPITYHMRLSKFLGQGNKKEVSHKTEPLFVWNKY